MRFNFNIGFNFEIEREQPEPHPDTGSEIERAPIGFQPNETSSPATA